MLPYIGHEIHLFQEVPNRRIRYFILTLIHIIIIFTESGLDWPPVISEESCSELWVGVRALPRRYEQAAFWYTKAWYPLPWCYAICN